MTNRTSVENDGNTIFWKTANENLTLKDEMKVSELLVALKTIKLWGYCRFQCWRQERRFAGAEF